MLIEQFLHLLSYTYVDEWVTSCLYRFAPTYLPTWLAICLLASSTKLTGPLLRLLPPPLLLENVTALPIGRAAKQSASFYLACENANETVIIGIVRLCHTITMKAATIQGAYLDRSILATVPLCDCLFMVVTEQNNVRRTHKEARLVRFCFFFFCDVRHSFPTTLALRDHQPFI